MVDPHEWKYDLLCSAATDPYTQCGLTKLTPISHLDDFSVHHLSNKYVGKLGISQPEMHTQVNAVLRIAASQCNPKQLLNTETNLWHGMYSKDYYEPISEEVISMVPPNARNVLSIGCGWGATECSLADRGLRVVAVPLDSVICSTAAERGVEMVVGDFLSAREKVRNETFDILLLSNVLHLVPDPIEILSLFRPVLSAEGAVVITSPNMECAPTIWRRFRNAVRFRHLGNYIVDRGTFLFPVERSSLVRERGAKSAKDGGNSWTGERSFIRVQVPAFFSQTRAKVCKAFNGPDVYHGSSEKRRLSQGKGDAIRANFCWLNACNFRW